jgi:hypothetical protein
MNKIDFLIDFLKRIPSTERRDIDSCPHIWWEDNDYLVVTMEDGTYFTLDVETEYSAGGDYDEFDKVSIEKTEIIDVTDIKYFNEDGDDIKIQDPRLDQLKTVLNQLPINY